ncbi:MAG: antibiotic biosynthesis monooxygenase family protein [Pseudomonadota bacterium]
MKNTVIRSLKPLVTRHMTPAPKTTSQPGPNHRRALRVLRTGALGLAAIVLTVFGLNGCAISTPFRSTDAPSLSNTQADDGRVIVVITEARVTREGRRDFSAGSAAVVEGLDRQPGLLGYSVRQELFGERAWTMTAWRDRASLELFLNGQPHRRVADRAGDMLSGGRFAQTEIEESELPLSWSEAMRLLDAEDRAYTPN